MFAISPVAKGAFLMQNMEHGSSRLIQCFMSKCHSDYCCFLMINFRPILIVVGTAGNVLIICVMRRGPLREISTCLYMRVLAALDLGKADISYNLYCQVSGAGVSNIYNCLAKKKSWHQKLLVLLFQAGQKCF